MEFYYFYDYNVFRPFSEQSLVVFVTFTYDLLLEMMNKQFS